MTDLEGRRPIASRNITFFHSLARFCVRIGLTPNQISVLSIVFALGAGLSFWLTGSSEGIVEKSSFFAWRIAVIVLIQLRLICNLIDGLMAVESGMKTKTGELYNEFPDRLSDSLILIGAGYSASVVVSWGADLGWAAALLACLTAYTRVLGASVGAGHFFIGPMAKQQRMFILTAACALSAAEPFVTGTLNYSIALALVVICIGAFITCIRRLIAISRMMNFKN